jgi:hypothetical protein
LGVVLVACLALVASGAASPEPEQQGDSQPVIAEEEPQPVDGLAQAIPIAVEGAAERREAVVRSAIVPTNSFSPPFDDYNDATGERVVSKQWTAGGHTDVHENFVRLTNDRQSKVGAFMAS